MLAYRRTKSRKNEGVHNEVWLPLDVSDGEIAAARRIFVRKARFQADESVAQETVDLLRAEGLNVRTADESGLRGREDEDHFAEALRQDRILLTKDADFLDDRRFPPHRNPGVVVLPEMRSTDESVDGHLVLLTLIAPLRLAWRGTKIRISKDREISIRMRHSDTGRIEVTRYRMRRNSPAEEWVD